MSLFKIKEVKRAEYYLDLAFRRATKRQISKRKLSKDVVRARQVESSKINIVNDIIFNGMKDILASFPDLRNLSPFYKELIRYFVDYDELKRSLGAVNWTIKNVKKLSRDSLQKMKRANADEAREIKNAYFGRVSSILKQVDKHLVFLENARRTIRNFPDVKNLPTACIVGFPNVGKTTLLFKLTGAKAKIAPYAFTTLGINAGYKEIKFQKIQFLDTPGTLNRFEKMNVFEKQAVIALKHLASIIVYVFDLTEPYPLEDQEKLYQEMLKYNKPTIIYLSKTDIVPQKKIDEFRLTHNFVSNEEDLVKEITKIVFKKK